MPVAKGKAGRRAAAEGAAGRGDEAVRIEQVAQAVRTGSASKASCAQNCPSALSKVIRSPHGAKPA
jgi:hypothetical protein